MKEKEKSATVEMELEENSVVEVKDEEMELEDAEVTPETLNAAPDKVENENADVGSDSPVVIGRKKSVAVSGAHKVSSSISIRPLFGCIEICNNCVLL